MLLGIVLLGLVAGWIVRPRLPRRRLPLVLALAFAPAVVHGVGITWWSTAAGFPPAFVAFYGVAVAVLLGLSWWWLRRSYGTRPFMAPFALPVQAFLQVMLTSLLGRSTSAAGVAVDILPGVALMGLAVAIASALVVVLPTRDHFPRFGVSAPRWLRALGRALGRRR
ncbi:MAG: hypothetical protein H0U69_16935 [Trueperaceae bacterium]|nr:hypothetical protein [Trueperaceae bacterium]